MKHIHKKTLYLLLLLMAFLSSDLLKAQQSVARVWNQTLLDAISIDVGRPTVHARNLWHTSVAMYDAWAVYNDEADTYLLGKTHGGFTSPFDGIEIPADPETIQTERETAISYAMYRLLAHRFQNAPNAATSLAAFDQLMGQLGHDIGFSSTDYSSGSAAALGNYIAQQVIAYGLQDQSNEQNNYAGAGYTPANPGLNPNMPGTEMNDLSRWQPLSFSQGTQTPFLGPHWGKVSPFSLVPEQLDVRERDGQDYWVYLDPGPPPAHSAETPGLDDDYKWNFTLVAAWSSHLDPDNGTMIDISPASIGGILDIPQDMASIRTFYNLEEGGVMDVGYSENPVTGAPYTPQIVPLGDFARVIAEFWADGPNSYTPPGHWFDLLHQVSDHPQFEKRFKGQGDVLSDLEWDVKSFFSLGGAVHDVAVAVWGIKAWYDYVRPISAIRGMAELGQSSDENAASYNPGGLPLIEGFIELVEAGDPLAGPDMEHLGKVKIYAWRGPTAISNPDTDYAGVGWILAENWWPYQRPSFVTPPFAGYISGHSTFSRASAEVLTALTGSEYFPGGMGEYPIPQNEYLVFEQGPSVGLTLQWARYRDASDQASLSRLWGGIHPPIDDCPGRSLGIQIGTQAFDLAERYFDGMISSSSDLAGDQLPGLSLAPNHPNPFKMQTTFNFHLSSAQRVRFTVRDMLGREVAKLHEGVLPSGDHQLHWEGRSTQQGKIPSGLYVYTLENMDNGQRVSRKMMLSR